MIIEKAQERFCIEAILLDKIKCLTHDLNRDNLRMKETIETKLKKFQYDIIVNKQRAKNGIELQQS